MKWVALAVASLAAAAVAIFAIYTWGWREDDGSDERATAHAYAEEVGALFCESACEVSQLERVGDRLWRVRLDDSPDFCFDIHLDQFRPELTDEFVVGAVEVSCVLG